MKTARQEVFRLWCLVQSGDLEPDQAKHEMNALLLQARALLEQLQK